MVHGEMTLGERVMQLMSEHGCSQKEFAKGIDAPPQTVSGWNKKNRSPTSEYIIPICRFFRITPNELFGFDSTDINLDEDEKELLEIFRKLDRKGRRAVLHEADIQDERQKFEGDKASTAN